ncbi:MAG: glycosyltransferase [Candidatus Lernaella stagnicola]|nr:glycosyltransferase [Candidatus Lernaella stagnicola]
MPRPPRILFLANWPHTARNTAQYAFFAHWRSRPRVRFFGTFNLGAWTRFEKQRLKFYILQPLVALFLAPFYDAVVAFSTQSGLPFALLLRVCFWMRTKLIILDVETMGRVNAGAKLSLVRFAARRIDHLVYAASGQTAYYDRHLPFLRHRRSYVPIGIGAYEKRHDFAAGCDGPILALGKHGRAFRDWATLLRAYAKLDQPPPLRIIGREQLPPAERDNVPVPSGVEFVPYMPLERLQDEVETTRFVVLPLPERGQSLGQLSILFCMAVGKAVVAADVLGVRDYLEPGRTGLSYHPGDADELAAAMAELLADPDRAVVMGRESQGRQRDLFADEKMGRRWEEIFARTTGFRLPDEP